MKHRGIHYFSPSKADVAWGVYATGLGHGDYAAGEPYPAAVHARAYLRASWERGRAIDEFQLVYIHRGQGRLRYRTEAGVLEEPLNEGDLFMLMPGVWHTYAPAADTGWEEYWIGISGSWVKLLLKNGVIPRDRMVYRNLDRSWLHALYDVLISYPSTYGQQVQAHLRHRIVELVGMVSGADDAPVASPHRQLLEAVRQEMETHFRQHRSIESFLHAGSERVGHAVSYSHFRTLFRQCYRLSPGQYLDHLRLAESKRLLHLGEMQVNEIAASLGFESPYYFSRFFKKHQGVSPKCFR